MGSSSIRARVRRLNFSSILESKNVSKSVIATSSNSFYIWNELDVYKITRVEYVFDACASNICVSDACALIATEKARLTRQHLKIVCRKNKFHASSRQNLCHNKNLAVTFMVSLNLKDILPIVRLFFFFINFQVNDLET